MPREDDPSIIAAGRIQNADPAAERSNPTVAHLESFFALALLTPDVAPPPELEERIEQLTRETMVDLPNPPSRQRHWLTNLFVRPSRVPLVALIMVIVALALSMAANVLLLRSSGFRPETALYLIGTEAATGARGVLLSEGRSHTLHVSGLEQLTRGYRYVVWTHDGTVYRWAGSITMLDGGNGRLLMSDPNALESIEVTIEETGKSAIPEGPRVLVGLVGW